VPVGAADAAPDVLGSGAGGNDDTRADSAAGTVPGTEGDLNAPPDASHDPRPDADGQAAVEADRARSGADGEEA
jgi:hypothetical protein